MTSGFMRIHVSVNGEFWLTWIHIFLCLIFQKLIPHCTTHSLPPAYVLNIRSTILLTIHFLPYFVTNFPTLPQTPAGLYLPQTLFLPTLHPEQHHPPFQTKETSNIVWYCKDILSKLQLFIVIFYVDAQIPPKPKIYIYDSFFGCNYLQYVNALQMLLVRFLTYQMWNWPISSNIPPF